MDGKRLFDQCVLQIMINEHLKHHHYKSKVNKIFDKDVELQNNAKNLRFAVTKHYVGLDVIIVANLSLQA